MLASTVLVATVWLAATNQLALYIHPRYVVFTVVMAVLGLVFVVASFVVRRGHDHDAHEAPTPAQRGISLAATVLSLALAAALIVIPPATLTTATAEQREINSTALGDQGVDAERVAAGAFAGFSVLDWAALLRQTSDRAYYADLTADVVGFVTPDPDDPEDSFYVSRFKVTCCAVDAQPVGVPVYFPSWGDAVAADEWVRVTGTFDTNPSRSSAQALALIPDDLVVVDQPGEPYLY